MSGEFVLERVGRDILVPVRTEDKAIVREMKIGVGIKMKWVYQRNLIRMKKYHILLRVGFQHWEPEAEYKGIPVAKNFDRFKDDVICAAGFYDVVISLDGTARVRPKSISYANMPEEEFRRLYDSTIDVLIKMVLKNYKKDDVHEVVNKLVKFEETK